jgi:hypothetical protein
MRKLLAVVAAIVLAGCGSVTGPSSGDDEAEARVKRMLEGASEQPTGPSLGRNLN